MTRDHEEDQPGPTGTRRRRMRGAGRRHVRSAKLLSLAALIATVGLFAPAAAQAQPPPPPPSDACGGVILNIHRVDATHVAATFKLECTDGVHPNGFSLAGTISRPGKTYEPAAKLCGHQQSCSETVTAYNPSGSQKFYFIFDPDSRIFFFSGVGSAATTYDCALQPVNRHMSCQRYSGYY